MIIKNQVFRTCIPCCLDEKEQRIFCMGIKASVVKYLCCCRVEEEKTSIPMFPVQRPHLKVAPQEETAENQTHYSFSPLKTPTTCRQQRQQQLAPRNYCALNAGTELMAGRIGGAHHLDTLFNSITEYK
jgi:hypothetical protein